MSDPKRGKGNGISTSSTDLQQFAAYVSDGDGRDTVTISRADYDLLCQLVELVDETWRWSFWRRYLTNEDIKRCREIVERNNG